MQIVLLHFGEVLLKNQGKKTNSSIIESLTGIIDYDAHETQIMELCKKITRTNYSEMKRRTEAINFPENVSGSTNISSFLARFESSDNRWISEIQKSITS